MNLAFLLYFAMNLDGITSGAMLVISNAWQTHICILMQLQRWVIVGLRVLSLKSVVNLPLAFSVCMLGKCPNQFLCWLNNNLDKSMHFFHSNLSNFISCTLCYFLSGATINLNQWKLYFKIMFSVLTIMEYKDIYICQG